MMTRRDYVKLAAALAVTAPNGDYRNASAAEAATETWRYTVHAVADVLQADNPRFNRAKFLVAAGAVTR